MEQGGLFTERLGAGQPQLPFPDSIPEAIQSYPTFPVPFPHFIFLLMHVAFFHLPFYYESFQTFRKVERITPFF